MSDESKHFSFPGPIVKRRGNFDDRLRPENIERFAREMKSNFDKHKVCGLVVGLPLADGDGALSPFALEVIETMSLVANCSNIWEDVNPTLHASEIVTLNQNYRAAPELVAASNSLASHFIERRHKDLESVSTNTGEIHIYGNEDALHEGVKIANILKQQNKRGIPFSEMAVLARTKPCLQA